MGLFDFLKRKPASPPQGDGPSPDYVFAHLALRQVALSSPLQFLAVAASPDSGRFIDSLLKDVARQLGRQTSFGAASIKFHQGRVKDFPCAVVELPEPKEIAEAFMVAVVAQIDMNSDQPPDLDNVKSRYFTLEKGFSLTNQPRTVLAEWTESSHANYGDGPAPNVGAFLDSLVKLL